MNILDWPLRRHPSSCARLGGMAIALMLSTVPILATPPAIAASVHAEYFAFADNGSFIDGDADTSTTRFRAVVDSGFNTRPIFVIGGRGDWTWQAKASSDLATGSLRTYAFSDTADPGLPESLPSPGGGWRSQSAATFSEAVTFVALPNVPVGPPVPITLRMAVDGRFMGFTSTMTNTTFLMVNGIKSQVDFQWNGNVGANATTDASATTIGTVTDLSVDPHQLHALLSVTVPVVPGHAISVLGQMFSKSAAGSFASATADFDHTAILSIELPPGYTFTSQSGVLLSVPEPGTFLPVAIGLLLVTCVARKRAWGVDSQRSGPREGA